MKRFFVLLFALALVLPVMADTEGRAKFVVTGIPNDGDTLTYRGNVRTWKTTITSSANQVQIGGSAVISANNLMTALGQYPFDTTSHLAQFNTTNITVIADANLTVTASVAGSWGTVTVTTTTLTQRGIALPFATESTTTRTNDANDLILAFNYASSAFGASVAALSNYVATTTAQNVTGAKTFTAANIYSNLNQIFYSGYISNIASIYGTNGWFTNLVVNGPITISAPIAAFKVHDSSGALDQKDVILSQSGGQFALSIASDSGATTNSIMTVSRSGATPTLITFGAPITGTTFTGTLFNGGVFTNGSTTNVAVGATKLFVNGPFSMTNGYIGFTNGSGDFPIIRARSTDAGSTPDHRTIELGMALNGVFYINEKSDDNTSATQLLQLGGSGGVSFPNGLLVSGYAEYFNNIQANGFLLAGADGFTSIAAPAGSSYGFYLYGPGSDLSVNPAGAFIWNNGGLKYRTDTASEGAGGPNYIHNRTGITLGAGTDYTLTGSTALVDFGTTDPKVTLPTDGTYLIWAEISVTEDASNDYDEIRAKLRNETTSADLTGSDEVSSVLLRGKIGIIRMQTTTTVSASNVISIFAFNNTAARGTVNSARTRIGYVRLY